MATTRLPPASDDTAPSTPPTNDDLIFSDAPHRTASPPSSPPGFPWEQQQQPQYRAAHTSPSRPKRPQPQNAFSLLGKRKALHPLPSNAQPTTKKPFTKPPPPSLRPELSQTQIALGQAVQKKCQTCGMEYTSSSPEDRALHSKFHDQNTHGYDVGPNFVSRTQEHSLFEDEREGESVVVVDREDAGWRRKRAAGALEVVQSELGAVEISEKDLWGTGTEQRRKGGSEGDGRFKVYMYIRGTKCVGLLLAERIESANRVVKPEQPAKRRREEKGKGGAGSALSALRARQAAHQEWEKEALQQPLRLEEKAVPATLGVSRIWTSSTHRGQGVAGVLLNTALEDLNWRVAARKSDGDGKRSVRAEEDAAAAEVRDRKIEGVEETGEAKSGRSGNVGKELMAFSQPTAAGTKLARKWFGKGWGWLVYVD